MTLGGLVPLGEVTLHGLGGGDTLVGESLPILFVTHSLLVVENGSADVGLALGRVLRGESDSVLLSVSLGSLPVARPVGVVARHRGSGASEFSVSLSLGSPVLESLVQIIEIVSTFIDGGIHNSSGCLHGLVSVLMLVLVFIEGEGTVVAGVGSALHLVQALVDLDISDLVLVLGLHLISGGASLRGATSERSTGLP